LSIHLVKKKVKFVKRYGIVMQYYRCNLFPGYIGDFLICEHEMWRHQSKVITFCWQHNELSPTLKIFRKCKDYWYICFDFIHYSYQIGTYWNSMAYITS